jgi:putative hydrolase of the HAD superfamily
MNYTTVIFDLDETLYKPGIGIWNKLSDRIHQYMHEVAGIPEEVVIETRIKYYGKYGTTMRGLIIHHDIDPNHYLDYVHDFEIDGEITFDQKLHDMIAELPYERHIFTNATREHAQRILKILGILDFFDPIVDIMDVFPHCKPLPEAFEIALNKFDKKAHECIFIDDSVKNLNTASEMGFFTVLPNADETKIAQPHTLIHELVDLPQILPPFN